MELNKRTRSATYVGIVRVIAPDHPGDLTAAEIKVLGVGWDRGPFAGWKAENRVSADPSECQLLVIIRSAAQAENAAHVLRQLRGQDLCIAYFTRNSRP